MLRHVLERFLASWREPGLTLRYWDGRARTFGSSPATFVVTVKHPAVLRSMLLHPTVAFGEAYTRGDIEVEGDLERFLGSVSRYVRHMTLPPTFFLLPRLAAQLRRLSVGTAVQNARHHYDLGNDFYRLWLDPTLTYSCAFFHSPDDDLATAQRQKLEVLCRKLHLERGQTLLDIGCGWGSLLLYAVEHYGVRATGMTPSEEQYRFVQDEIRKRGLQDRCEVRLQEWREVDGTYDRIVSVGMFEHVGHAQYASFFRQWNRLLKPGGVSVLHTIGRMRGAPPDPWITKYIFPGAYLPALDELVRHTADNDMDIRDVENLRPHYALTLDAWSRGFQEHRPEIVRMVDETFARMWWLYLRGSAASFRYGRLCLWQLIIAKDETVPLPLTRAHLLP